MMSNMTDAELQALLKAKAEEKDGRPYNDANVAMVMDCLHYNGSKRALLAHHEWLTAYLLCNGFGDITMSFAEQADFDWSHVRDSSPIGFDRAAQYIRRVLL